MSICLAKQKTGILRVERYQTVKVEEERKQKLLLDLIIAS